MASQDLHYNVATRIALNGQAVGSNTTTVGNVIDTQFFEALELVIRMDSWTDGLATPLVEDSSDGITFAPVSNVFLLGLEANETLNADNTSSNIGYSGKNRYVRLSIVSTGVTTGFYIGADAVLGFPHTAPTDQTPPPM